MSESVTFIAPEFLTYFFEKKTTQSSTVYGQDSSEQIQKPAERTAHSGSFQTDNEYTGDYRRLIQQSQTFEPHYMEWIKTVSQLQEKQKQIITKRQITSALKHFSFDDEGLEAVWRIAEEYLKSNSLSSLGNLFQEIYISSNDNINTICGICQYLASFDLDDVSPWGTMILICALNHKDETVKEYAVTLLDNWKDKSLAPVLRNLDCHSNWLRKYIENVLHSLEE